MIYLHYLRNKAQYLKKVKLQNYLTQEYAPCLFPLIWHHPLSLKMGYKKN